MTEYIKKDDIRWNPPLCCDRNYQTFNLDDAYEEGYDFAQEQILKLPAANVRENVKGEWIEHPYSLFIGCSVCDEVWNILCNDTERFNFCPNCGACVRGGKDETN